MEGTIYSLEIQRFIAHHSPGLGIDKDLRKTLFMTGSVLICFEMKCEYGHKNTVKFRFLFSKVMFRIEACC